MSFAEIISLYRHAFTNFFFYQSASSQVFQTLSQTFENEIKLKLWQQAIERVAELIARQLTQADLSSDLIIEYAQSDAARLSAYLLQQQQSFIQQVPSIEYLLKIACHNRLTPVKTTEMAYSANREDIKNYLESISANRQEGTTQSFYQFIKVRYPDVVVVSCAEDLSDLDLSGGQFQSCDFSGANIRLAKNADFRHCQLIGADLTKADLTGTDFQGANLSLTKAQGAQFKAVNLTDTHLMGVDFSQAYLDISRSENSQWIGAQLTDILTESLYITEQLQKIQSEQVQQFAQQYKRQQQWWDALLPAASKLAMNLAETKMTEAVSDEQKQTLSILTQQLQQIILTVGLMQNQVKELQKANLALKITLADEPFVAIKQQLKALRADLVWQHLLAAWQEVQADLAENRISDGFTKVTEFISQSQAHWEATQQKLQAITATLNSNEKRLHLAALKQWQTTRVRMAFDQALIHIESEVSRPYRQAHQVNNEEKPLSCFISYSWGDPVNEKKVHRIAADLRQAGIGMLLDIWDNKPGTSVSRFTHETRNCDVVLLTGTLKLMEKWRIKMGVVSQEIPQIYGRLDQTPIRRVIGLQLNGETLDDVLPQEFLERKKNLEQNDYVDLRQVYELGIFEVIRGLYQVQPNTNEALVIDAAERAFVHTSHAIEQAPIMANVQALGYEKENISAHLSLSLQAIQRYEVEKQAQKRALENLLPTTLNKLYQAYEARQKQEGFRVKDNQFGLQSNQLTLAQPLVYTISHVLAQAETSPVLLLKTTPETFSSMHLLEKTLWRQYQADPEHQPIPVVIDFRAILQDCNGQLPDNYDTVTHVLKQQLHYGVDEIQRLKDDYHLVFIFSHYEALNQLSYAPYIDNHLELWNGAKAVVFCDNECLKGKNYQTVFSAGKQFAHLKLWEGETITWTTEYEQQWQTYLKDQPIVRSVRELTADQIDQLRDYVIQEQLTQALKMVQKRLGAKAPSLYVSYAPGEPETIWQMLERLLLDLPQAGFKVLMDIRKPSQQINPETNSVMTVIPSSRYLQEMMQSDFILVTGSRWYLQQYEQKAKAIQQELDIVVTVEEASKGKSQGSKNFTSPIMPLLLERPLDPRARLETVLPPLQALRDSVCIDFKRADQAYYDVLFDQLVPALYQASVYQERHSIIQEAYQQFKQAYQEIQRLDAEGLLQKAGYKQPTLLQAEQYLVRQAYQLTMAKAQLNMLVPTRLQPLYQAHQQRVQQPELSQALAYYVSLDGQLLPGNQERFDLAAYIETFLYPENSKAVLLLQGESGSGKSLALHRLEQHLWQAYRENPQTAPIPILIELKAIEADVPTRFIEDYLKNRLGYTDTTIKALKDQQRVIFLMDGYDELPGKARALYQDNELWEWQNAKVVVTVRPSYIQMLTNARDLLRSDIEAEGLPQECFVSPFSQKQIDTYLQQYVKDSRNQRSGWHLARYQTLLAGMPSLQGIMTSPLLLRMVVEVLPELSQQSNHTITRADVYRLFIARWFTREDIRLLELGTRQKGFDAQQAFGKFAEKLAFHMFLKGLVEVHFDEAQAANQSSSEWVEYFRSDDPLVVQKRAGCPLKQVDNRCSFYHKSFLEYFAALYVYQRAHLDLSSQNFQTQLAQAQAWPINQKSMVADNNDTGNAMLNFLAEMVGQRSPLVDNLLALVKASAISADLDTAASNAITVLNRAKFAFSGLNLQGIRIPAADLSFALLDHTNLSDADLTKVRLVQAWLPNACLDRACLKEVFFGERPFLEHTAEVLQSVYSADGQWVATSSGTEIYLWEVASGTLRHILIGHQATVRHLAFHPTQPQLISAADSPDHNLRVWDINTGKLKSQLRGHSQATTHLTFSSNGERLLSSSADKTLRLWNMQTCQMIRVLTGHTNTVTRGAINANGLYFASASTDGTVRFWDERGHAQGYITGTHPDGNLCFDASGKYLIDVGADRTLRFWRTANRQLLGKISDISGTIQRLQLSPNGQWLAALTDQAKVMVWDSATRQLYQTISSENGKIICLAFSSDSKLLATGSQAGAVELWNVSNGEMLATLTGHKNEVLAVQFSPDGLTLVSASQDKTARLWNVTQRQVSGLRADSSSMVLKNLQQAPQKRIQHAGITMQIVEESNTLQRQVDGTQEEIALQGHTAAITCLSLSQNGRWLASGSLDKTVRVWSMATGECLATLQGYNQSVVQIVWLEKENLVTYSQDQVIKYWQTIDIEQNKPYWQLIQSTQPGSLYVQGCSINQVKELSALNHRLLEQLQAQGQPWLSTNVLPGWGDLQLAIVNNEPNALDPVKSNRQLLESRTPEGWTLLHIAARYGYVEKVQELLALGADWQAVTLAGEMPGQLAQMFGKHNVLEFLPYQDKKRPDATPLHLAVLEHRLAVVEFLLAKKVALDTPDQEGLTALWLAAKQGDLPIVRLLRNAGASLAPPNAEGETVLHWAVVQENLPLVELLLLNPTQVDVLDREQKTALQKAILSGKELCVPALIAAGADLEFSSDRQNSPLNLAAEKGLVATVEQLIAKGVSVNAADQYGNNPLMRAIKAKQEAVALVLIDAGADVNLKIDKSTPLHYAAEKKLLATVRRLIDKGAQLEEVDSEGNTPLLSAGKPENTGYSYNTEGREEWEPVMLALIEAGANIMVKNGEQRTALHYAAENGWSQAVNALIAKGTQIDQPDSNARTALSLAFGTSGDNYQAVVRALIHAGANINIQVTSGYYSYPLIHIVIEREWLQLLKDLIAKGIQDQLNVTDPNGLTPLLRAVVREKEDIAVALIEAGADPNAENVLANAIDRRLPRALASLVATKKLDLTKVESYGRTPLMRVISAGFEEVALEMIKAGANVEAKDTDEKTILYWAAEKGMLQVVNELIAKGVQLNETDNRGTMPLHQAGRNGHEKVMLTLIAAGADVSKKDTWLTPLHAAAESGLLEAVKELVAKGAQIDVKDSDGNTPLIKAINAKQEAVMKALVDKGANIQMALHAAAEKDWAEAITYLIDKGAPLNGTNEDGVTPLMAATKAGREAVMVMLIDAGADIHIREQYWRYNTLRTESQKTVLHYAAEKGLLNAVNYLISKGAQLNAKDVGGTTPLHQAADAGHEAVAIALIEAGADINIVEVAKTAAPLYGSYFQRYNTNKTALHYAAKSDMVQTVKLLVERGADVDAVDCNDSTPLLKAIEPKKDSIGYAVEFKPAEKPAKAAIMLALVEAGADPNVKNKETQLTPLHFAVKVGLPAVVKELIAKGAVLDAVDKDGKTPLLSLTFPFSPEHWEVVALLAEAGANIDMVYSVKTQVYNADWRRYDDKMETRTILHHAASSGNMAMVKMLLDNGVNSQVLDSANKTAAQLATDAGYFEISEFITNYKQQPSHSLGELSSFEATKPIEAITQQPIKPLEEKSKQLQIKIEQLEKKWKTENQQLRQEINQIKAEKDKGKIEIQQLNQEVTQLKSEVQKLQDCLSLNPIFEQQLPQATSQASIAVSRNTLFGSSALADSRTNNNTNLVSESDTTIQQVLQGYPPS